MAKWCIWESESEVSQLCPTLCDPMNCSLPVSSVCGILQARILEWVANSFSMGIFLTQGSKPGLPHGRRTPYHLSRQVSPWYEGHQELAVDGGISNSGPNWHPSEDQGFHIMYRALFFLNYKIKEVFYQNLTMVGPLWSQTGQMRKSWCMCCREKKTKDQRFNPTLTSPAS